MLWNRHLKPWVFSIIFGLPVVVPYLYHFALSPSTPDLIATGFIQDDQPYYMANAREIFESEGIPLAYGNPNYANYETPKIYFQPHIWMLGLIHKVTNWDPGFVYLAFGLFWVCLCLRICWTLFEILWGLKKKKDYVIFFLFLWGAGIMSIMGMGAYLIDVYFSGGPSEDFYKYLVRYDPEDGWWFLSFGRNLLFPTEAYYHTLFFLGVCFVMRNRLKMSLWIGLIMSFSHPFTGIQYLLVLFAWLFLERFFWRNNSISVRSIISASALIAFHLIYYKVLLSLFDNHKEIEEVWTLDWSYKMSSIVGAYAIVGLLAILRIHHWELFKSSFSNCRNRFLGVWFFISFLLANHEFLIEPIQPLHFTRGYIWTPLFLFAVPVLRQLICFSRMRLVATLRSSVIVVLLLLDNLFWLPVVAPMNTVRNVKLKPEEQHVLGVIENVENKRHMVLTDKPFLNYMVTVYTPHRAFTGHSTVTPQKILRHNILWKLFSTGHLPKEFARRNLIIAVSSIDKPESLIDAIKESALDLGMTVNEVSSSGDVYVVFEVLKADSKLP